MWRNRVGEALRTVLPLRLIALASSRAPRPPGDSTSSEAPESRAASSWSKPAMVAGE